ncbi:putative F-box protein At3g16210 [Eucalyptus grandis]|uniref:putative F-box protein At3g16210 n=1 Tax=Eucalyptus grandis TaxID=71139 RepID=UPI00192E8E3F|nr:putative F-box protein At3g16210 [Eucalyptus grandis]
MSSSASDDDYPKLPHDAVVQILKRLPVRSLLRFRCVCRSWRSTIDGPSFVDLYQKHVARDASNWHLACVEWCDPLPPSEPLCFLLSVWVHLALAKMGNGIEQQKVMLKFLQNANT